MTAQILDGKATAAAIKADLKQRVAKLAEHGVTPGLGTVLVGDDPGSRSYVAGKHRDCDEVGIASIRSHHPADIGQEFLEDRIRELNDDPTCTGFIVQLPLPKHLDTNRAIELVDPSKDADGLHPMNLGRLVHMNDAPLPCTPRGIVELLRTYDIDLNGAEVCVVGRGVTVGRPLGLLLTRRSENATVTLCHTGTRDLADHVRRADIVVAAAGVRGLITADMVKPGAAVLDVGVSRGETGIVGDVAPEAAEVAGFLAPMPGGVGPMTRALAVDQRRRGRRAGCRPGVNWLKKPSTTGGIVYLVVMSTLLVGVLIAAAGPWRTGVAVMGGALGLAFVARAVLPDERAGMLRIRRRFVDLTTMVVCCVGLFVLAVRHPHSVKDSPALPPVNRPPIEWAHSVRIKK